MMITGNAVLGFQQVQVQRVTSAVAISSSVPPGSSCYRVLEKPLHISSHFPRLILHIVKQKKVVFMVCILQGTVEGSPCKEPWTDMPRPTEFLYYITRQLTRPGMASGSDHYIDPWQPFHSNFK